MNWRIFREAFFIFTTTCFFLFIVLLSLAIFFYPGGSRFDPSTVGFDFLNTFVSDLGRNIAINGEDNSLSQAFFITAITLMGISQIYYFLNLPFEIRNKKSSFVLAIIGCCVGFTSAILNIAIAYNPWDVNTSLHNKLIYTSAPLLCVTALIFIIAIFIDKEFSKLQGYCFVALFTFFALFAIATSIGTKFPNQIKWNIRILGHLIFIYIEAIIFILLSFNMYKRLHRLNSNNTFLLENENINQAKI